MLAILRTGVAWLNEVGQPEGAIVSLHAPGLSANPPRPAEEGRGAATTAATTTDRRAWGQATEPPRSMINLSFAALGA